MSFKKGINADVQLDDRTLEGIRIHQGKLEAQDFSFGIVVSRFNTELTQALLHATISVLREYGAQPEKIDVAWVPGAFEIPTMLEVWASQKKHDAFIALGVVIAGATPHAASINREVSHAMVEMARTYQRPIIDGVVVAETADQARERSQGQDHNRGAYAARAAVEMAQLLSSLKGD